jgi:hypothetical protein
MNPNTNLDVTMFSLSDTELTDVLGGACGCGLSTAGQFGYWLHDAVDSAASAIGSFFHGVGEGYGSALESGMAVVG